MGSMESPFDGEMQDANGAVVAQLGAIVVTAQAESPSEQQPCRTPVDASNDEMETLLDNGELPAPDIVFRQVPAGFNYHSTLRSMIPMAFGQKGKEHVSIDTLWTATRELEGAVGVLIEDRFLSTLDPQRAQAEVKGSLDNALHAKEIIVWMRTNESAETIANESHRFGKHIQADYLESCYKALHEVQPGMELLAEAHPPCNSPALGAGASAMDGDEGASSDGRQSPPVHLLGRPPPGVERLPRFPQPRPERVRAQNAVLVRDLNPDFPQGEWVPAIIKRRNEDGTYCVQMEAADNGETLEFDLVPHTHIISEGSDESLNHPLAGASFQHHHSAPPSRPGGQDVARSRLESFGGADLSALLIPSTLTCLAVGQAGLGKIAGMVRDLARLLAPGTLNELGFATVVAGIEQRLEESNLQLARIRPPPGFDQGDSSHREASMALHVTRLAALVKQSGANRPRAAAFDAFTGNCAPFQS